MAKINKMSRDKIEEIKNVIIVGLLLCAILLLYLFWKNTSIEIGSGGNNLKKEYSENYYALTVEDILKPEEINIGFGEKDYRKIGPKKFDMMWDGTGAEDDKNNILSILKDFSNNGDVIVEEIDENMYETINNDVTVNIIMPYSFTFDDFCNIYELKKHSSYSKIHRIKRISYTKLAKDSLFVFDDKEHKFYRLISAKKDIGFDNLIKAFSKDKFFISYELGTIIGVENSVLIPLSMESPLEKILVKQDIDTSKEEETSELAKKFFGEGLEFVRKITHSDNKVIYMYGYGKQVLTIEQTGKVIYTENSSNGASTEADFITSLEQAIKFITAHKGWQNLEGERENLYLKDVEYDNKKNRYKFIFGLRLNSNKVFYASGEPLTISVEKGKVVEYEWQLFRHTANYEKQNQNKNRTEVYPGIDILTENYKDIYNELVKNNKIKLGKSPEFEDIIGKVTEMETGYLLKLSDNIKGKEYYSKEEEHYARPVWKVSIGENRFFYDLYTGKKITYKIEN